MRLPAHITLIPPLRRPEDVESRLVTSLSAFTATQASFRVGLDGFAWFVNRTLFVHVSQPDAVRAFHAELTAWCATQLPEIPAEKQPFIPHMTLATRDLPPGQVPALRQQFAARSYAAEFAVQQLTLFRHNGQQWQPRATFDLNA